MALTALTTKLARAVIAVEQAKREAQQAGKDEAYELTFAEDALTRAVRKHSARETIDAATFKAQKECARRGFEGMPS